MKIEIPDNLFGKPIKGAMEKVLAKESPGEDEAGTDAPSLGGFEYVPSIGLYVEMQKEFHGKNWNEATQELHSRGDRKPTPYEFVEFIKHLRMKNTDEARAVLDEIYSVRDPWRAEWLDARFDSGAMKYYVFGDSGIEEKTRNLTGVLMDDKFPGINLETWLSDNEFGFPKNNIDRGLLYYWKPADKKVARFGANLGRAVLDCYGDPDCRSASLGVRAVRRLRKNFLT